MKSYQLTPSEQEHLLAHSIRFNNRFYEALANPKPEQQVSFLPKRKTDLSQADLKGVSAL